MRYGVDRFTAYADLFAIGFPLPAGAARWAHRPSVVRRRARQQTDELDDEQFSSPNDWFWVCDRRVFVVGYTSGGAPFGHYEDDES
ncbi:MAG: hypothetical protein GEU96_18050 [Propionibacteriales bacterium]|nr:hypothetical protein [Propionibacteriales bacterium]